MPKLPPIAQTHPHIATQIASAQLRKTLTGGVARLITFVCKECHRLFRKRADNVVRSGRALCRNCSACPDSKQEQQVVQTLTATMESLRTEGVVCSYNIKRNLMVSKAELFSVPSSRTLCRRPLKWDITIIAKIRSANERSIHTQKIHIELDGVQHFRFSKLWHGSNAVFLRAKQQDSVKDSIVERAQFSSYGKRFKRISLLRLNACDVVNLHSIKEFVTKELRENNTLHSNVIVLS